MLKNLWYHEKVVLWHIHVNYERPSFYYTPDLSGRIMVWRGRLSVCLSVCLSTKLVNTLQTEPFKLGLSNLVHFLHMTRGQTLFVFQGQGSKVKVTCYTLMLNLVNTIQTELFKLGPSNLVHILLMTRGRHLLIFKVGVKGQGHAQHYCKTL